MSKSIPALIKPALLVWAREREGLSLEEAAERIGIPAERLREWEQGTERPSMSQLRTVGDIYRRPIAVFFLREAPLGFDPQREFRRLPGVTPKTESPELRLALRNALYRREIAKELLDGLREPIPEFSASLTPTEPESTVVAKVRTLLGIPWEKQRDWQSGYAAFNAWREAIESKGVLVFQTGGIELSEMRGTSIPHGPLPVIVINNADAPHGRIFTLMHEFVHIMLANGGHRTSTIEGKRLPEDQYLERVSNRLAAAILMPSADFLAEAKRHPEAVLGDERALKRFADRIKVSPEAILRRLVSLDKAPASIYRKRRREWQGNSRWYVPLASGSGGPPTEVKIVSSRGRSFVSLVLEGYERNVISSSVVSDILGIQLKYLDKVARHLMVGPGEGVAA